MIWIMYFMDPMTVFGIVDQILHNITVWKLMNYHFKLFLPITYVIKYMFYHFKNCSSQKLRQ